MSNKTAEDYRQAAADCARRREESWERSDTDGFLSQWASGLNRNLNLTKAEILENDGKSDFIGLYEGDRRVKARVIETKFGHCWLLHEDERELIQKRGKPFLPCGGNSRIHKNLGVAEAREMAPAWCHITGTGTGLSGNAWVATFRSGDKWGQDSEKIEE